MPDTAESAGSLRDIMVARLWHGVDPLAGPGGAGPVDVQGWSGSRHPWLEQAVEGLRPRLVVEVGVWKGASTLFMAEALRRQGGGGVVLAVDTWLGSSEHRTNPEWFASLRVRDGQPALLQTFLANVRHAGLREHVLPLPLDSMNAAELVRTAGLTIDLIHVDAGHDSRSVAADLAAWWPLLRPGGVLIGDDYYADGAFWPGVAAAFDGFTAAHGLAFEHAAPKIRIRKPAGEPRPLVDACREGLDRSLPAVLDYAGEFGPELVLCLPFLTWLSALGLLRGRRVSTYRGMRCFYDALDCLEVVEKPDERAYIHPDQRAAWLPVRNEHDFDGGGRCPQHLYPDLRRRFAALPLLPDVGTPGRPLLVIHNKHNSEWGGAPINHIGLDVLETLFRQLGREFTLVYVRHGMSAAQDGFVDDRNHAVAFDDRRLLDRHPGVLCFDDLHAAHRAAGGTQDVNTFKNVLYSRCHRFVSSQGGGAHQIALYSGSLLVVLHRQGSEEGWAYGEGYYGFMASPPPTLAVCRTGDDLVRALPLFVGSSVVDDRAFPGAGGTALLAALSPRSIGRRPA